MIFVLSAVLVSIVLLFALLLKGKEQHHSAEYPSSSYLSCGDLSMALREICRGVLTPKTLMFLSENAPTEVITSFGKQQQRLARYSLRVASDTLVQSLARRSYKQSNFSGGRFGGQPSDAWGLFLLAVCTVGRMELSVLRSVNWSVPRSVQAWISAKTLMSLGTLLDESNSVTERRFRESAREQNDTSHESWISDRPSGETSLGKQIHDALWKALPNDLSRMIYVATMRDNNSGHYYYPELTQKFSVEIVDRAILACHRQLFDSVVQLSLEDLTESLDVYMAVSCLSWKWRTRSSVKITERTYEERTQALHC